MRMAVLYEASVQMIVLRTIESSQQNYSGKRIIIRKSGIHSVESAE